MELVARIEDHPIFGASMRVGVVVDGVPRPEIRSPVEKAVQLVFPSRPEPHSEPGARSGDVRLGAEGGPALVEPGPLPVLLVGADLVRDISDAGGGPEIDLVVHHALVVARLVPVPDVGIVGQHDPDLVVRSLVDRGGNISNQLIDIRVIQLVKRFIPDKSKGLFNGPSLLPPVLDDGPGLFDGDLARELVPVGNFGRRPRHVGEAAHRSQHIGAEGGKTPGIGGRSGEISGQIIPKHAVEFGPVDGDDMAGVLIPLDIGTDGYTAARGKTVVMGHDEVLRQQGSKHLIVGDVFPVEEPSHKKLHPPVEFYIPGEACIDDMDLDGGLPKGPAILFDPEGGGVVAGLTGIREMKIEPNRLVLVFRNGESVNQTMARSVGIGKGDKWIGIDDFHKGNFPLNDHLKINFFEPVECQAGGPRIWLNQNTKIVHRITRSEDQLKGKGLSLEADQ